MGVWPAVSVKPQDRLPVGLVGNALAVNATGTMFSVGGYTGVTSLQSVYKAVGSVTQTAALPVPTHDAAAGFIGSNLYVFGGGQSASYNTIVEIRGSRASIIGYLPRPLSDAVCVPYEYHGHQGLALVGGYDGQVFNDVVRFVTVSQGKWVWDSLFTLPQGVRYPAVAALGNTLYIAGGKFASGQLSRTVYSWSTQTNALHVVGTLSSGVEKAALFAVPGYLVLAGGLNPARVPQNEILAIDVRFGALHMVGHLPVSLADLGYAQVGGRGFLVGGMKSQNETNTSSETYTVLISS